MTPHEEAAQNCVDYENTVREKLTSEERESIIEKIIEALSSAEKKGREEEAERWKTGNRSYRTALAETWNQAIEALKPYCEHTGSCAVAQSFNPDTPCICGLASQLEKLRKP